MSRALIVTGRPVDGPAPTRMARLEQLARLYARLDLPLDLLVVHPGRMDGPEALDLACFQKFGVVRQNPARAGEYKIAALIRETIARMGGAEGYALGHLDGVPLSLAAGDGPVWIADALDGHQRVPPLRDLAFAALETIRGAHGGAGIGAVRLPLTVECSARVNSPPGGMIGWPVAIERQFQAAWTDLLAVLEDRAAQLPGGLLLEAANGFDMRIPKGLRRFHAAPLRGRVSAKRRVLGLGILPGNALEGQLHEVLQLLAAGRPVLTTDAIAAEFEGRWRLPTADSAEGLAGWIEGWLDGRDVDYLNEAARETHALLLSDAEAMEVHALEVLKGLLARVEAPPL